MANYFSRNVPTQWVTIEQLSDNLRILLSEILLIRNIGEYTLHDSESETYNTSYISVEPDPIKPDPIEQFIQKFRSNLIEKKKTTGTVILDFYNSTTKSKLFGLSQSIEKIIWEKWFIKYTIVDFKGFDEAKIKKVKDAQEIILLESRVYILDNSACDNVINFIGATNQSFNIGYEFETKDAPNTIELINKFLARFPSFNEIIYKSILNFI